MFRKRLLWIIVIALLLVIGGGGYYYYTTVQAKDNAAAAQPTTSTATVTRGDLSITASGSGTLVPATQLDLGFKTSGVLAELPVKVGDKVEAGQLLARLDETNAQEQVDQAQISLRQAQISLDKLIETASADKVSAAQGSLASAKAAYPS